MEKSEAQGAPEFYLRFFEACGWEKECWVFYIPLTAKNLQYLTTLHQKLMKWKMTGDGESLGIDSGSRFKFLTMPVSRADAEQRCASDAGGYMKKHNLLTGEVSPKALRHVWGKKQTLEEYLYKGGIMKCFPETVEA